MSASTLVTHRGGCHCGAVAFDALTEYRFGTGVARHLFCRSCGVKSFYVPRSNPDGYGINARCLDGATIASITVEPFDGRHWEASAGALRHLSQG